MKKAALAILAMLMLSAIADARPGGGHSSSGGGRSSSSSRSGGGGYRGGSGGGAFGGDPAVALVVIVVFIVIAIAANAMKSQGGDWSSGSISYSPPPDARPPANLAALQQRDPDLSVPVLEDFIYQLFSAAHRRRSSPEALTALAPWLSQPVIDGLLLRGEAPSQVVIGTLRLTSYAHDAQGGRDVLRFQIEATLHTRTPSYVTEEWTVTRSDRTTSKAPATTRTWNCPNCGAPWEGSVDRKCQHCGEIMNTGKFDWFVERITLMSQKGVLASLTGTVAEYGNDLPTVYSANAMQLMDAVTADDPNVTLDAVRARVGLIYARLNEGWNTNNLKLVRGLATTALRDYMQYWLDEYKRQGLSNRLDSAAIDHIELSKVTRDRHFDAITLRVRAHGCDYTLDRSNSIVGGSNVSQRYYTEYWTVLRSSSARGKVNVTASCPSCGAPLADGEPISDTGTCTYCNAQVENGQFDWILSKIEQDDTYRG